MSSISVITSIPGPYVCKPYSLSDPIAEGTVRFYDGSLHIWCSGAWVQIQPQSIVYDTSRYSLTDIINKLSGPVPDELAPAVSAAIKALTDLQMVVDLHGLSKS